MIKQWTPKMGPWDITIGQYMWRKEAGGKNLEI